MAMGMENALTVMTFDLHHPQVFIIGHSDKNVAPADAIHFA